MDELNKSNVNAYKRNLSLESGWTLGGKYGWKRDAFHGVLFPSDHLVVMNFENLLLTVVLQFSCCILASFGQVCAMMA